MKRIVRWMLVVIVLGSISGCIKTLTPEGKPQWKLDPCSPVLKTAEDATEAAIGILGILGGLWPVLTPVAMAGVAGLGYWKKIKPKLTKAQNEAALYYTSVDSLVTAIEDYKEANPEDWEKLKEKIKVGPNVENVIRALRGLPLKE